MLRQTLRKLAVNAYSLFLIEQKANPKLANLSVPKRGRATARMYRALSRTERQALERRAARTPAFKRVKHYKVPKPHKPNVYSLFVKSHYNDSNLRKLSPTQKLKAIAKLWHAKKAGKMPVATAKHTSARKQIKQVKSASVVAPGASQRRAATGTRRSKLRRRVLPQKSKPSRKGVRSSASSKRKAGRKSSSLVKGGVLII